MSKIILFCLSLALMPSFAQAQQSPTEVTQEVVNSIIHILNERQDQTIISEQDRVHIRQTIQQHFDFTTMAKRSMGKSWKRLDKAQRLRFTKVFTELMERQYGNKLNGFHGQTIEFTGETIKSSRHAVVNSEVIDDELSIPIDYVLRTDHEGHWRIYDIKVEDVSMIATYKTGIRKLLKKKGFEGLMEDMNKKLSKLRLQVGHDS